MKEELKPGEFVGSKGINHVFSVVTYGGPTFALDKSGSYGWVGFDHPDAIPAVEAFLVAAKEAANPWVEWGKNGQGLRIRKDGTDAQFRVDGGGWVFPGGFEEEFNGYRAALRAYGITS